MTNEPTFGAWLKQRRKALGLTQPTLGQRVGCAGETIRKIEAGRLRPSEQIAERLAEHLAVPSDERTAFVRWVRATADAQRELYPFQHAVVDPPQRRALPALPAPLTSLVGRLRERAEVAQAVTRAGVRLLTLMGPPGIGKTRLGVQVAWDVAAHFADGAVFVELAPISDPELVVATLAQSVAATNGAAQSPLERVVAALRDKQMLVVLDNFEQVQAAGASISAVLERAPGVTILVTSRIPLQVYGEHEYVVPPLALPERDGAYAGARLAQVGSCASIRLFVERAQAARSDFALTAANAPAVVDLCLRMDGVPLAIELAAARMKMFTPQTLAARFTHALDTLSRGAHNVAPRQQTLRNAIAWSYALLPQVVRAVLNRLGVFVGGFTLEAAAAVCALPEASSSGLVDELELLLNGSLIQRNVRPDGRSRFRLLETIREYAYEQLVITEDATLAGRRHAEYYLALAEQIDGGSTSVPNESTWQYDDELDNFRAVLRWSLAAGEPARGLRLIELLYGRMAPLGLHDEGQRWTAQLLAHAPAPTPERAGALSAAAYLALRQGAYDTALALLAESRALALQLGDTLRLARAILFQGMVAHAQGDAAGAVALYEESLAAFRLLGDTSGLSAVYRNLGDLAYAQDEPARALRAYEETLDLARAIGHHHNAAYALRGLGHVARQRGDVERAATLYRESLLLFHEIRDRRCMSFCLEGFGCLASRTGAYLRAAQLLGAAEALRSAMGVAMPPAEARDHAAALATLRLHLPEATLATAWASGQALSLERAVGYALSEDDR